MVNVSKYILFPLLSYKIARDYVATDVDDGFKKMADKYNFSYYDYNDVNLIIL